MNKLKPKPITQSEKLVCDWTDKEYYLLHYRNLKMCVRHAMLVEKVYKRVSLNRKPWSEVFLHFDTEERAAAENGFVKDLPKSRNLFLFSETVEKVRINV